MTPPPITTAMMLEHLAGEINQAKFDLELINIAQWERDRARNRLAIFEAIAATLQAQERWEAALNSIANNSCCSGCQEAALVAKRALGLAPPPAALAPVEIPQGETAQRTLASVVAMLGWMHMPPRETIEREIATLKALASHPPALSVDVEALRALERTWRNVADALEASDKRLDVKLSHSDVVRFRACANDLAALLPPPIAHKEPQ